MNKAAEFPDELDRLREIVSAQSAEIERLRKALEPLASGLDDDDPSWDDMGLAEIELTIGDLRRARAALESALGQQQGKKHSAADNLRNWAKAKATEDNDYLRADLLSNAACIEDLAAALKEFDNIGMGHSMEIYDKALKARAALERWGLR